jgi:hypothetical protein
MNVSIVEMVMAMVVFGIILASAVLPTVQVLVTYQEVDRCAQSLLAESAALVRAEQLLEAVWRDPNAPAGHGALLNAQAHQFQIGNWEWRGTGTQLQQQWQSGGWARLAEPVQTFAFEYLMNTGEWRTSVPSGSLAEIVAARFDWADPNSALSYGSQWVFPDYCFAAGLIGVHPVSFAPPYYRSDYERSAVFSLGMWP